MPESHLHKLASCLALINQIARGDHLAQEADWIKLYIIADQSQAAALAMGRGWAERILREEDTAQILETLTVVDVGREGEAHLDQVYRARMRRRLEVARAARVRRITRPKTFQIQVSLAPPGESYRE